MFQMSVVSLGFKRTAYGSVRLGQCKIHWQSNGDFLCVKVDRHTKTKKTLFCNLEVFRLREKGLPVESIDIKGAQDMEKSG